MRRSAVLALIVLVLAPAGVRAATWYRSDGDGAMRAQCCCPVHPGQRGRSLPGPEMRSACCCTIITLAARDAAVRAAPPIDAGAMPAIAPAVSAVAPPAAIVVAPVDRTRAARGPPGRPDLFVRHCALLL